MGYKRPDGTATSTVTPATGHSTHRLPMLLETKHIFAAAIQAGEAIADVFFIVSAQQGQAKNGPYWRLVLQDATGSIEGKIWSPFSQEYSTFDQGEPYLVVGRAKSYRDRSELVNSAIRPLTPEEKAGLDLKDFLAASPHDTEAMLAGLEKLCKIHVTHPPLRHFLELILADTGIRTGLVHAPAAKAMHHAYAGGLLEHTLSVCELVMKICEHYPQLDRQILLAGALCHDLGKMWELSSGVAIDYTDEGRLLGHIILGMEKLQPVMVGAGLEPQIILHLQHLIISHHGMLEFGSPKLPATAEALVLHYADNIDAKMQQVGNALAPLGDAPSGWSSFVTGLDRFVYRPASTPSFSPMAQVGPEAWPCAEQAEARPNLKTGLPQDMAPMPDPWPCMDDFQSIPDASYEAMALAGSDGMDALTEAAIMDDFGHGPSADSGEPCPTQAETALTPPAQPLALQTPNTAAPTPASAPTPAPTPGRTTLEQGGKTPAAPLPRIQQCSLLSKE